MLDAVLDLVYPRRCGLCDRVGEGGICGGCRGEFEGAGEPRLRASSEKLGEVAMLYAFRGRAAQAVKRLKYERATVLAREMAGLVAEEVLRRGWNRLDAAVPVPISGRRYRERGFNQAELLCEGFDPGWVRGDWMKRVRHTRPQAALNAAERLKNLEGAFWASEAVAGKSILLVDDVATTGGTAVACAETLAARGATSVFMITFCGEQDQFSGVTRP